MKMKKTLLIVAAIALFAGPALAYKGEATSQAAKGAMAQASEKNAPRLFSGQGVIQGNAVYDCTGKYLGSDPDPNVRAQILRQGGETPACSLK
jgi:hypothetical protein